jgi:hypothetical protein
MDREELENRVTDLEFALELAIGYIQDLMGSDSEDSVTLEHLERVLNG